MRTRPNKKLLILGGVFLSIVIAGFIYVSRPSVYAPDIVPPPTGAAGGQVSSNNVEFNPPNTGRVSSNEVVVKNFYQDVISEENGNALLVSGDDYQVSYSIQEDIFYITITNSPFPDFVTIAEARLLNELNIGREDACNLNVVVRTVAQVNPQYATNTYRLSFCQ